MSPAEKRLLDALTDATLDAGYNTAACREAVRLAKAAVDRERGWEVNYPQGRRKRALDQLVADAQAMGPYE